MQTATINVSTNADTYEKANALFTEFGLDMSSAINLFLQLAVRDKTLPFTVGVLKKRTTRAAKTPTRPRAEAFGCMKGKVWMADDFNAPLEDFKDYM